MLALLALLNNSYLGMVRQWQELFFERRYSEIDLSDNPDFCALAQAFGVKTLKLDRATDMEATLQALLAEPGPVLLHVAIDQAANVWPLVPPNRSNTEMMDADEPVPLECIGSLMPDALQQIGTPQTDAPTLSNPMLANPTLTTPASS